MGGGKIVFCVTLMCTLIFSSCNKDERVLSSAVPKPNETPEQYLERRMNDFKASGKTVTVEHATLEEINDVMKLHGLPQFSDKDVIESRKHVTNLRNSCQWPCNTWNNFADWNNSGFVSTIDLTLAMTHIYNCSGSYTGSCTLNFNDPDEAWDFSVLKYLETCNLSDWDYILDYANDVESARKLLLGIITCT